MADGGVEINTFQPPSWAKYPVEAGTRGRVTTCSDPFSHRPHSGLTLSNIDWQIASNNICQKEKGENVARDLIHHRVPHSFPLWRVLTINPHFKFLGHTISTETRAPDSFRDQVASQIGVHGRGSNGNRSKVNFQSYFQFGKLDNDLKGKCYNG